MSSGPPPPGRAPQVIAKELGLDIRARRGNRNALISWDELVDLAVDSYWTRRPKRRQAVA